MSRRSRCPWRVCVALPQLIMWSCRAVWRLLSPILLWNGAPPQLHKPFTYQGGNIKASLWKQSAWSCRVMPCCLLLLCWPWSTCVTLMPKGELLLTSKSISIATGAGGRRGALGPDDRGKGTLLFDSRKHWRGEWEDGRRAGRSNSGTGGHDWKAKAQPSFRKGPIEKASSFFRT